MFAVLPRLKESDMLPKSFLIVGSSILAAAAASFATGASAHSVTVIGNNADAIACYRAAESEARRPDAVALCSAAIQEGELSVRDQMATFVNRGIVRFRIEEFDGAIADFDAALALQPGQPDALVNKGITMLAGGAEIDNALTLIDQGIANRPQRPWVGYYGRGVANELAGRDAQAYRDYRRAQELRPGWAPAEQALTRFSVRS
jgi:tetratricopeptide (TPR) repeat protein